MRWQGTAGQQRRDLLWDASGSITTGGTAQLLLPEAKSRSFLSIQNLSAEALYVEFGSARATATLSGTTVASCSVTNAGMGFTYAPDIDFLGGGAYDQNGIYGTNMTNFIGCGMVGYPAPNNPARAHCVMSGSAGALTVSSIVIDNPGSGYLTAPYVFIHNRLNDPNGVATPSATSGILLAANGGSLFFNGTVCPTDAIAIFGGTTSQAFSCKYME